MRKYKNKVRTKTNDGEHTEVLITPLVGKTAHNARKTARVQRRGGNKGIVADPLGNHNMVWESGLEIVKPPINIIVPASLVDVMTSIEAQIKNAEFSIYVKADISNVGDVVISEEYCIPDQNVSMADVEYNDPPVDGFNAVIHKHPSGMRVFSTTDDKYINKNFEVSLLWCDKMFVTAIVNYEIRSGVKLQLEGEVVVGVDKTLPVVDVGKIHKAKIVALGSGHLYPKGGSAFGGYAEMYGHYDPEEEDKWKSFTEEEHKLLELGMM